MKILTKGKPRANSGIRTERVETLREEMSAGSKTVKFSMNIPRSLHKEFRKKCFLEDKDMKDVLLEAIEQYMKS